MSFYILSLIPDYMYVVEVMKRNKFSFIYIHLYTYIYMLYLQAIDSQTFGSQQWDTGFAIQALLASNIIDEIGPTLAKGHDYIKKSQV